MGNRSLGLRRLLVHQGRQHTPNHRQKEQSQQDQSGCRGQTAAACFADREPGGLSRIPSFIPSASVATAGPVGRAITALPTNVTLPLAIPCPSASPVPSCPSFCNHGLLQACASQTDCLAVESADSHPKRRSASCGDAHATNLGSMDGCYALSVCLGAEGAGFGAREVA